MDVPLCGIAMDVVKQAVIEKAPAVWLALPTL